MITNEKVKKVVKYVMNIFAMISALIVGLNAIDGITIPNATIIVESIAVINGVAGTYLLGQKALSKEDK